MKKRFEFELNKRFDPELLKRVEDVFHGENLVQIILHAHLLIERALTLRVSESLARPEILEDGKYGRWSFHQKLALYIGLYDPSDDRERMLLGFNKLRNMIAHRFEDEAKCVLACLPWEEGGPPETDAHARVLTVTLMLLFWLGALKSMNNIEDEPPHT